MPSKYVKALQLAREEVAKTHTFICGAIVNELHHGRISSSTSFALRDWVRRQLEGATFYSDWLRKKHPEAYYKMLKLRERRGRETFTEGRLAWIDWMIANVDRELK